MEGMGLKFIPVVVRHLLGPLSMTGPKLAFLGLIVIPNSPNQESVTASGCPPSTTPPISTHTPTYTCHL